MSFSSLRRPQPGEAIPASLIRDIVRAGIDLQAQLADIAPPAHPRGARGRHGSAYLAPPPPPRLSLLAPCIVSGGQLGLYRPALSLLGDIELPADGQALAPWYAIWCSSPRAEGGTLATTPPRNEGWVCTELSAETRYTLLLSCYRPCTAPREVWFRDPADVSFLPLYAMHGGGGIETYAGLDITLAEGDDLPPGRVSATYFSNVPLGSIVWSDGEPTYLPHLKLLSA